MPTVLFESLSESKKSLIIKASIKEFSECSYENASINSIIKEANISRGSFYQYFEDKEDLYIYIMTESFRKAFFLFEPIINNNSISIKNKILGIFDKTISYGEDAKLFVKMILNMKYAHHKILIEEVEKIFKNKKTCFDELKLNDNQTKAFFDLIFTSFGVECFSVLTGKTSYEESRKLLQLKIDIIKGGLKLK